MGLGSATGLLTNTRAGIPQGFSRSGPIKEFHRGVKNLERRFTPSGRGILSQTTQQKPLLIEQGRGVFSDGEAPLSLTGNEIKQRIKSAGAQNIDLFA